MVQIRMPASAGRAYYDKKIAESKSPRAATRSLKRHLSDHVWRIMLADENTATGNTRKNPGGRLDNREAPPGHPAGWSSTSCAGGLLVPRWLFSQHRTRPAIERHGPFRVVGVQGTL